MRRSPAYLAVLLAGLSLPVEAQTDTPQPAGTNFPSLKSYPDPSCIKPGEPPKRPGTLNMAEVDRYNALLVTYNKAMHDYVVCINLYIRNADSDMDLIRKKSRDAADEANR